MMSEDIRGVTVRGFQVTLFAFCESTKVSHKKKERSIRNLNILLLLFHKVIVKCLYKCGRMEIFNLFTSIT